jgi:hypothetical protein
LLYCICAVQGDRNSRAGAREQPFSVLDALHLQLNSVVCSAQQHCAAVQLAAPVCCLAIVGLAHLLFCTAPCCNGQTATTAGAHMASPVCCWQSYLRLQLQACLLPCCGCYHADLHCPLLHCAQLQQPRTQIASPVGCLAVVALPHFLFCTLAQVCQLHGPGTASGTGIWTTSCWFWQIGAAVGNTGGTVGSYSRKECRTWHTQSTRKQAQ